MPAEDDLNSGGIRIEVQLMEIVKHIDAGSGQLDEFRCGQLCTWAAAVNVSAYGDEGRQFRKPVEDGSVAYIPHMKDVGHAAQGVHGFRAKQAVCV